MHWSTKSTVLMAKKLNEICKQSEFIIFENKLQFLSRAIFVLKNIWQTHPCVEKRQGFYFKNLETSGYV